MFSKLSQQQWLLSVLTLGYQNGPDDWSQLTLADVGGDPLLWEFAHYMSSWADVALPLLWGAWWCYREGLVQGLLRCLSVLIPFFQYNNNINYVFATVVHLGMVHGNQGGIRDWLVAGHFRLSSAETGELAFRHYTSRVNRFTNPSTAQCRQCLFDLVPGWEAARSWKGLLGLSAPRPHRAKVAYNSKWCEGVMVWFSNLWEELVHEHCLPDVAFPRGGGWLQRGVVADVHRTVQTRLKTLTGSHKSVVESDDGVEELRALGDTPEHSNWVNDLRKGKAVWLQELKKKAVQFAGPVVARPTPLKYAAEKAPPVFVSSADWLLIHTPPPDSDDEAAAAPKVARARSGVPSKSSSSRVAPVDSESDDDVLLSVVYKRLCEDAAEEEPPAKRRGLQ